VDLAGDGGAPATTIEGACAAQASADCALRNSCTAGLGATVDYGSTSACVSLLTSSCVASFAAPGTGNSIAHTNGCAGAYPGESCTDWYDDNTTTACRSPAGSGANGAACGESSQCASGFCSIGLSAACGTCEAPAMAGTPCTASSSCFYGLECPYDLPATSGVCTPHGAAGASCDNEHRCGDGLGCVGADATLGIMGTCQTAATAVGAACGGETGPECDGAIYLTCVDGACQAEVLAEPGAPCGSLSSGYAQCTEGATCITPEGACQRSGAACGSSVGSCVAAAANGSACNLVMGPLCQTPARCVVSTAGGTSGTCVALDPASCG
jgi:hypothetical protein